MSLVFQHSFEIVIQWSFSNNRDRDRISVLYLIFYLARGTFNFFFFSSLLRFVSSNIFHSFSYLFIEEWYLVRINCSNQCRDPMNSFPAATFTCNKRKHSILQNRFLCSDLRTKTLFLSVEPLRWTLIQPIRKSYFLNDILTVLFYVSRLIFSFLFFSFSPN